MGIYWLENIYLYKSEGNSLDPNVNGGEISNYPFFYRYPNVIFNKVGIGDIARGIMWRKIFVHNKTNRVIRKLNIFPMPIVSEFDYFNSNYQFYVNYGDINNLNDYESDIDYNKSFGVLKLINSIECGHNFLFAYKSPRENQIKQDLENIKTICIFNIKTISVKEILYPTFIGNPVGNIIYMEFDRKFLSSYDRENHVILTGLSFENIDLNKLVKFWIGFELYNLTDEYIIDFSILIHWLEASLE